MAAGTSCFSGIVVNAFVYRALRSGFKNLTLTGFDLALMGKAKDEKWESGNEAVSRKDAKTPRREGAAGPCDAGRNA